MGSLLTIAGLIFLNQTLNNPPKDLTSSLAIPQPADKNIPAIVSTKPDPLEGAIITASEEIEISFNKTLENEGEFKLRIDPEIPFKIQLSSDRKTAKIIPQVPYELGKTYTLFIKSDTKFDGIGQWGQEKIFHVNTVRYRGI